MLNLIPGFTFILTIIFRLYTFNLYLETSYEDKLFSVVYKIKTMFFYFVNKLKNI